MNASTPAGETQNSTSPANEPELMVQFRDVSKHFGDLTVLNHLDLNVRTGEKVAIIGPSGSGKTTVLRSIAGLRTDRINADVRSSVTDNSPAACCGPKPRSVP